MASPRSRDASPHPRRFQVCLGPDELVDFFVLGDLDHLLDRLLVVARLREPGRAQPSRRGLRAGAEIGRAAERLRSGFAIARGLGEPRDGVPDAEVVRVPFVDPTKERPKAAMLTLARF